MIDDAGAREHGWADPATTADPLAAEWPATIVVADDDPASRRALSRILEQAGYHVLEAPDGDAALARVRSESPSLVILDIAMPGIDGIELCRRLRADPATSLTPIVHVTGTLERAQRLAAIEAGSDEFLPKPFDAEELLVRARSLLRTRRLTEHLVSAEAVMVALARTIAVRDAYTERHLTRVADQAVRIATVLRVPADVVEQVRLGGLLHDLGKIAVPDAVLRKPAPLTREEFAQIRIHPEKGAEIVQPLSRFTAPEPVVLHHHEHVDGSGYPFGLRGDAIPLAARIVAVADAFDAMTTDRPYRAGMPREEALHRLWDGRGRQWDPTIVEVLVAGEGVEPRPTGSTTGVETDPRD